MGRKRGPRTPLDDAALLAEIRAVLKASRFCSEGHRKVRVRRPGLRPAGIANHLARDFVAHAPNTKWVSDITYIRTGEGWVYLVVVLDLYTRCVIGWSMSDRLARAFVLRAVRMALWQRVGDRPVILHLDRGTQYTSEEYKQFLAAHGIVSSMSAVGSCYDNAVAESFFGLLKRATLTRMHERPRDRSPRGRVGRHELPCLNFRLTPFTLLCQGPDRTWISFSVSVVLAR